MSRSLADPSTIARLLAWARQLGPGAIAHAVHGLVLFVAVVGATYVADYPSWRILGLSVGSVVLFWVAHVYSAVLGAQHSSGKAERGTVSREARRALPLVQACLAPAAPLLLAALGLLPLTVAYVGSLVVAIATLAGVGFLAPWGRRAPLRRAVGSALVAGGFGAAIIAAETFLH